ncbi:MAG TPA: uroporphyrinogen-III synthase [Chloroflexi bacterium]|nr:uroporphyrinogen-III synthase [Chloroflexota bacterium]
MIPRPLAGKRVVNTRAPHQAADLDALLRRRGAEPLSYPCIDMAPPEDAAPLDEALRAAAEGRFDWLVLTSRNAVLALARRLETLGLAPSALGKQQVAAVGPATAEAARRLLGVQVALTPAEYVAESLADALCPAPGMRVFLPQSEIARPVLKEALTAAGAEVTGVTAYRTVMGRGGVNVPAMLSAGQVDAVAFTSPSTVHNFLRRLVGEGGDVADLAGVCVACIGPVTARAAHERGLEVQVVPEEHTLAGLIAGLEAHFLEGI